MTRGQPHSKIADEINRIASHYFVGRDKERGVFLEWLTSDHDPWRILNVYGTGGVGKSYLLDEYRRMTEKFQFKFVLMDSRVFSHTPHEFCLYLLRILGRSSDELENRQNNLDGLVNMCMEQLLETAKHGKTIVALDTFEEFGELENWLRDDFLGRLDASILVIISGRLPLQGRWQALPAWRKLIYPLPLDELDFEAVRQYLERSDIREEEIVRYVWMKTRGHPLTMSLLVASGMTNLLKYQPWTNEQEVFFYVTGAWLKEVSDRDMREVVEAAAIARYFNQEILGFVLDQKVTREQFSKLTSYSFIRRVDNGWLMHDLLRDTIGQEIRLRCPEYYDKLWSRCIMHYYLSMKKNIQRRTLQYANESAEWVYYTGDQLIRALFYQQSVLYQLEPLSSTNFAEAELYVEHRLKTARDTWIKLANSETGPHFDYFMSGKESVNILRQLHLKQLFELDRDMIKLIRDSNHNICGMSAIVPIHEHTLGFLQADPTTSPYFASLTESKLKELRTPAHARSGYFVLFIDVPDYADLSMRHAAGLTFITHMLSAGLVLTTAPAIPFFRDIFLSLGFEQVKKVVHFSYDGKTPTPYYIMDTRGNKLHDYLNKMMTSMGSPSNFPSPTQSVADAVTLLSRREKEVAELLAAGYSNLEIAKELYLSEATVKKHISNVYRKLNVKNRVQLIHAIAENNKLK